MKESVYVEDENLKYNKERWGDRAAWLGKDGYGYSWGGTKWGGVNDIARFADKHLRPHIMGRYDLKGLELSPGGGRFTVELMRYCVSLDLVDMNQACLTICRDRFDPLPLPMRYYANDGKSLAMVEDRDYDLIACFDSMVHMHPDIIRNYVMQMTGLLKAGGRIWLDHSGKGMKQHGHRTDMTPEKMAGFASAAGLDVVAQTFRNDHDCISVLARPL
jgi:SAM-dependent methyltransferase